jgi:drug/metabolite transporter (DMT)-like permease
MTRPLAVLTLLLCTLLWGFAFLFQKNAMAHMGPLTFTAIRYGVGTLLIAPLALREYRRRRPAHGPFTRRHWVHIAILVVTFFAGVWAQQAAMQTSTVTNGGFLTSLYVIFTPLAAFILVRHKPHPIIYLGAPLALLGIYLLTGADFSRFTLGDGLLVICALSWAVQIAVLADLVQETLMPVVMSFACFVGTALLALLGIPFLEHPVLADIGAGWIDLLYTGVFSTAVAFTLQAIGQQHLPASNAAIVLSSESLFAALAGAIFLGERLPPLGYLGAAIIFGAIVLVELVPQLRRSTSSSQPAG